MIIMRGTVGVTLKLLTCLALSNSNAFKYSEDALTAQISHHVSKVGLRKSAVKRRVLMDDDRIQNLMENTANSSVPSTSSPSSKPYSPSNVPTAKPSTKPTSLSPVTTLIPIIEVTTLTTKPSPLFSTAIPASAKPTFSPTSSNNTVIVAGKGQTMSINQSNQDYNQSKFQATSQTQNNSVPVPIIISTAILVVICLLGIGVAITAWILGGPEEEFDEKSQESEFQPSFFERMMMSPQREIKSPSNSVEETKTHRSDPKRKRRKRRERKHRERKYDTNITENERAIKESKPSDWLDRFLDNTISKVC